MSETFKNQVDADKEDSGNAAQNLAARPAERADEASDTDVEWQPILGLRVPGRDFVGDVLRLFARSDIRDELFWKWQSGKFRFFVNVNDVFWWGTGDLEEITETNFSAMEQAVKDCEAVDATMGESYAGFLFAARMRQLRPQGASYPQERELWPLFDACGPERDVGFGNPYRPGEYKAAGALNVPTAEGAQPSPIKNESSLPADPEDFKG